MEKSRLEMSDTDKSAQAEADRVRMEKSRLEMSEDKQKTTTEKDRKRKALKTEAEKAVVSKKRKLEKENQSAEEKAAKSKAEATAKKQRDALKTDEEKAKARAEANKQRNALKNDSCLNAAKLPDNYPPKYVKNLDIIEPVRVGRFNKVCTKCGAYMLATETHKGNLGAPHEPGQASFSLCCSYGTTKVERLQEPPDYLKELLTGVPASVELELAYQKECTKRIPNMCYSTAEKKHYKLADENEAREKGIFNYEYVPTTDNGFFDHNTGKYNLDKGLDHESGYGKHTKSYLEKRQSYKAKCHENTCEICKAVEKMGAKACHECAVDETVRLFKVNAERNNRLGVLSVLSTPPASVLPRCSHVDGAHDKGPKAPCELTKLLNECRKDSNHFRTNIRKYNNVLSFASKGFSGKHFEFKSQRGPPVFKISGQMYHNMTNVLPNEGESPQFSQMYVYDEEYELDARMAHGDGLKPNILEKLQTMMHEVNPLVTCYKHAADIMKEDPTVDIQMVIKSKTNENNKREFRAPQVKDVGIFYPQRADNDQKNPRDVVLYRNQTANPAGNKTVRISTMHPWYDPTAYPIIHPFGELGFELGLKPLRDNDNKGPAPKEKKLNTQKFYQSRLMTYSDANFDTVPKCGRLFQEYCCDAYSKIEGERLRFIEHNQAQLRAEVLDGLADALRKGSDDEGQNIGKEVRMPASFVQSPRWTYANYLDSLAIARKFKKFSWFITNTCNPKCQDVLDEIDSWHMFQPNDRPDVIDRVYKEQMKIFHADLEQVGVMGEPQAYVNVYEQQMRSLWHCHNSLLTKEPVTESELDSWVSAQIPDKGIDPVYYEMVINHMLHGPCGENYPNSPCMVTNKDGKKACRAGYPKAFTEHTHLQHNGYPAYARPNNGRTVVKNGKKFDNTFVVPHNRYLLLKYGSHINVEFTASLSTLRYQFKYFHKGNDLVTVKMTSQDDGKEKNEVDEFVNARYIDCHLAWWRMIEGPIVSRFPAVVRLAVHEEDKQFVTFKPGQAKEAVENPKDTTLIAWLKYNKEHPTEEPARNLTYMEFPEYYTYNLSTRVWKKRVRQPEHPNLVTCIGRLNAVMRVNDDRYYLRMLLHNQAGAKSFEDLRKVGEQIFDSYKSTCLALGLLADDSEIIFALNETYDHGAGGNRLRNLFAIQLKHCEISNAREIYESFKEKLFEDVTHQMGGRSIFEASENAGLIRLDDILQDMGSSLSEFPDLPQPDLSKTALAETRAFRRERYDMEEEGRKFDEMFKLLNPEQLAIFEMIKAAIDEVVAARVNP